MSSQNPQQIGLRHYGVHHPIHPSSYGPTRKQEALSNLKKIRSFKKHFANNFHVQSQLQSLGINDRNSRLQTVHSKLDVRDIIGASADTRSHQIERNKYYGKSINFPPQNLYLNTIEKHLQKYEPEPLPVLQLPNHRFKQLNLQINQTLNFQRAPEGVINRGLSQRRVKTQLQEGGNFPVESRVINRWSPTFLTSNSNPFVFRLPRIS